MKPRIFEEPVEELLILSSQPPPKFPPLLDFLLQNPAERKYCPSHRDTSMQLLNCKL
jgi:hypothetical protein